jgi:dTDP-glucose 4,6-dehydratase
MLDSDKTVQQRTDRKFLFRQEENENGPSMHDPVNIGNPRELTVLEIAKLVLELTRSLSHITHHPLPADDPKVRRPDISRARTLLKWEPQVQLEDALSRTIEYFRKVV